MSSHERTAHRGVVLIGGEGNDTLTGGPNRDALYGNQGDDLLIGSPAPDKIFGNAGFDTVDYSRSTAGITVNLATFEVSGGDAMGDRLVGIERVIVTDHGDTVTGDDEANTLEGRGGDDTLTGGKGTDTLAGGVGNDALDGGTENDTLAGGAGTDTLDGGAGDDTLDGGAGADTIRFGRDSGRDTLALGRTAGDTDVIELGKDIAFDQLWYAKVDNNLEVSILGSEATIVLTDFYGSPPRRSISLRTQAGETLDANGLAALEMLMRDETRPEASSEALSQEQRRQLDPALRAVWDGIQAFGLGDKTEVNTDYVGGQQRDSAIAVLSGGGYVVVWDDEAGQDGSGHGIYAQRIDDSGARVGNQFRVNTYTSSAQYQPAATGLSDGGYVITWSSNGPDGSNYGVFGQRYDAKGSPVGSEFQINTYTSGNQLESTVTALADGGFVVAWTNQSAQDGSSYGVFAQRFAADGTRAGLEFQVNTYTSSVQYQPAISTLTGGGFVIAWASSGPDGSDYGIFGQRFAADGTKVGDEFQVNTYTSSTQDNPTVAGLTGGGFVVLWESNGQDGSGEGVYGQIFDKDGQTVGDEFRVNSYTSSTQARPAVTALDDGGFMASWGSNGQDGSGEGIYGQRFNAAGAKVGGEFQINEQTWSTQYQPEIATLADGSVAVTWSNYTQSRQNYDINTRVLERPATTTKVGDADGNALSASDKADGGGTKPKPQAGGTDGDDTLTGGDGRDNLNGRAGNDTLTGGGGVDRLRGGRGNDSLAGGTGNDILRGDQGNDVLSGGADRDILLGGRGNDTLIGGGGADRYTVGRGDGADSIDNADAAKAQDTLAFQSGIQNDQLWFAKSGQDLVVSVIGTNDAVTIEDWYTSADNRHLTITAETADGGTASLTESHVQKLVAAMASFSPPALGTLNLSSSTHGDVETVITASWQLGG